jgi:hypothetical protein
MTGAACSTVNVTPTPLTSMRDVNWEHQAAAVKAGYKSVADLAIDELLDLVGKLQAVADKLEARVAAAFEGGSWRRAACAGGGGLMPAVSQAQRAYLNAKFGHAWVKKHGFDNKGRLPRHAKKRRHDAIAKALSGR